MHNDGCKEKIVGDAKRKHIHTNGGGGSGDGQGRSANYSKSLLKSQINDAVTITTVWKLRHATVYNAMKPKHTNKLIITQGEPIFPYSSFNERTLDEQPL